MFLLEAPDGGSIKVCATAVLFSLKLELLGRRSHVGSLSTSEEQKRLACDVIDTRASLVLDLTDTDCQTLNGSI